MKVVLAVQAIASNSVSKSLRWLHGNSIDGFDNEDVLATADFIELHDKLFDILNSRNGLGTSLKSSLSACNFTACEDVFSKVIAMYKNLTTLDGKKCGFLGLLTCIQSVKTLYQETVLKAAHLESLSCYKFSQDHLETFFSSIRLRNGWAYNPTPKQFRWAFRKLLVKAGKNVLGSVAANCIAQDETVVLSLSSASFSGLEFQQQFDIMEFSCSYESGKENDVENHFCTVRDCKVCSATIAYIAGFYCKVLHSALKCIECRSALKHSEIDPCPN
ncbi:Uncharacterized protein FKW44_023299, partial [Caligus rogercresseyi]